MSYSIGWKKEGGTQVAHKLRICIFLCAVWLLILSQLSCTGPAERALPEASPTNSAASANDEAGQTSAPIATRRIEETSASATPAASEQNGGTDGVAASNVLPSTTEPPEGSP